MQGGFITFCKMGERIFKKESVMEQIYTIPVNEAFDRVTEGGECACPFCLLYKKLEEDELEIILGASMMEPDIRIKTNEMGFCSRHYSKMLLRKRMLGMGLMMQSHLPEVKRKLKGPAISINSRAAALQELAALECDCYVCTRINKNINAMTATAVYLWESEPDFRRKLKKAPFFCLPHYRALAEYAMKKLGKKSFADLYDTIREIEERHIDTLQGDVDWFCKKFDYRYDEEPWYNSKDSVQRSVKFLSGEMNLD